MEEKISRQFSLSSLYRTYYHDLSRVTAYGRRRTVFRTRLQKVKNRDIRLDLFAFFSKVARRWARTSCRQNWKLLNRINWTTDQRYKYRSINSDFTVSVKINVNATKHDNLSAYLQETSNTCSFRFNIISAFTDNRSMRWNVFAVFLQRNTFF